MPGQKRMAKRVMITGAGGGIGRALVARYQAEGASVIAHDRSAEALSGLSDIVPVIADLRDRAGLRSAFEAAVPDGIVDVLINNAGVARGKLIAQTTEESFDEDIDVNLKGAFAVSMLVVPGMKARRSGAIVNISTVNALGSYGHPAYSAAKAGMLSLTRSMAVELGPFGIRVNALAPGTVRTAAWNDRLANDPAVFEKVLQWYPLRRVADPEDVANVAAFLASDQAAIITGAVIAADCGLTAGAPPLVSAFTREEV
jgi:NAD(P)-dependent dehydrogenase (short-subunit alcohol dehydrogenase family)